MKKLLSIIAAAAMLFGLASCSGDLHDAVDPNKMEGNWSYLLLDSTETAKIDSGTMGIVVNKNGTQSGAFGTNDYFTCTPGGTLHIIWDGFGGSKLITSLRDDNPTAEDLGVTVGDDEFLICVFTKLPVVNVHYYDKETTSAGSSWPGVATTATVTVSTWELTIKGIKIENCPEVGSAGYIAICESWIPDNEWGAATTNKIEDSENPVLEFASPVVVSDTVSGDSYTAKIQVLNPASDDAFWDDPSKVETGTAVAVATEEEFAGKTVWFVLTVGTDGNTAAFVEAD